MNFHMIAKTTNKTASSIANYIDTGTNPSSLRKTSQSTPFINQIFVNQRLIKQLSVTPVSDPRNDDPDSTHDTFSGLNLTMFGDIIPQSTHIDATKVRSI
jgi:hypothetical protein